MHRPRRPRFFPLLPPLILLALLAGSIGGLARLGLQVADAGSPWVGSAAAQHGALMISAFLGSVIALERAVALKQGWTFAAPLLAGAGGLALLAGRAALGAWLGVAAAGLFVGVNALVLRRQLLPHTLLLMAGALCWLLGNLAFALRLAGFDPLPWWFALLVLTIAAERLEMTRLMRRRPAAEWSLYAVLALLLGGAALSPVLYGAALTLLAAWLLRHDIARRTVHAEGLSRYMAVCLLGGYGWLAVAGLAWVATTLGWPARDAALHGLGLGFVFSMVMGHAPVILPAVAGIKLLYGPWFYAPLALLHASLLLRLGAGPAEPELRALGAALNAAALALFALTLIAAALLWRARKENR
ncbi:hypothetical protein G8A07_14535 [Roseateles sp. DAIF2]|nr:hypothetical protein G8A07_14535 [Roseateles sp. DAIF2]